MRIQAPRVGERPTGREVPRASERGQESGARRGERVGSEVLFLVRCPVCAVVFAVCDACYAGHRLCGKACRVASVRAARRRHQRSPEGASDHRDHNRAYRDRRREKRRVMDVSPVNFAADDLLGLRDGGPVSTEDTLRRFAGSMTDDQAATDGSNRAESVRDADRGDGRAGRGPSGGPWPAGPGALPRGGDVSRGAFAVAPAAAHGCVLCGRRGQLFCVAPVQWSRRRGGPPLPTRRRAPRLQRPGPVVLRPGPTIR